MFAPEEYEVPIGFEAHCVVIVGGTVLDIDIFLALTYMSDLILNKIVLFLQRFSIFT